MIAFILTHAKPLLWSLGIVYLLGAWMLWSCLAMSKQCEVEDE